LPVYAIFDRLKGYYTTKKDIKKGIDVVPSEAFKISDDGP